MRAYLRDACKRIQDEYLTRQRWQKQNHLKSNTNLNYSNMDTMTENETERLKELSLAEMSKPFTEKHTAKVVMNDQGLVAFAQVTTREVLTDQKLDDLMEFSSEYNLQMQVQNFGPGLKITFKLKIE